jgi:hypothetical protein
MKSLLGAVFLAASIATCCWAPTRQGGDFIYPYLLSHGILHGEPIYDRQWQLEHIPAITGQPRPGEGIFYPAGTGFATLPFVALSFRKAQLLWLATLVAAVVLGIRTLLRVLGEPGREVPWTVVAGIVLFSASIRWGMTPLQGAPLIVGLLCLFVACLDSGKYLPAFAITTFVLVFKPTVALPFGGLLLLHRRFREIAAASAIAGMAHVAGFARVGGLAAFRAYTEGIAKLEAPGSLNTPDPWDPKSSPRIDWIYLYTGLTGDSQLAKQLSLATTAFVASWLLWSAWRVRARLDQQTTACFLLALTCLGMLCVYHHHYDVSAVIVPLLMLAALHRGRVFRLPANFLLLAGPLVAMIALFPVAIGAQLLRSLGGRAAVGYMNIAFPSCVTLALIAGCLLIQRLQTHE